MQYRTLDLFCGAAGGWTLGLHRAGFVTVAACEIDPWRRAVFGVLNPGVMLYDDIRDLTAARLLGDIGFLPEIVCGSPPCQDASLANPQGRGVDGERTGLFFEAVRLVREVRPRWVLLENVPGLRTRGYDRVHDALEAAGYAVWPLVVGAVHAGAPHRRQRVWVVALAKSAPVFGASFARSEPNRDRTAAVADAYCIGVRQQRERDESATVTKAAVANADEKRREGGRMEPRLRAPQESKHRCSFLEAWAGWNGGPPEIGRVDDGLSEALASRRGLGRACVAAYGDAVVPQLVTAIGHAIRRIEGLCGNGQHAHVA